MPSVEFEDKDLIEVISLNTKFTPNELVSKKINVDGNLEVFFR